MSRKGWVIGYKNAITDIAFDFDHDGYVDLFVGSYFQPITYSARRRRDFSGELETATNGGGVRLSEQPDGTFPT